MELKHMQLKAGGRVLRIHGVAHSTYKGVADWYFLGDLVFEDTPEKTTGALNREVPPYAICYDHANAEAKEEADAIFNAMNEHLLTKGKWHDPKHMKDGRVVTWTPKQKTGLSPL